MKALQISTALVLVVLLLTAAVRAHQVPSGESLSRATLMRIAQAFDDAYEANEAAVVYQRFDAPSREVISESSYVMRHRLCPDPPGAATVLGAAPAGAYWIVLYQIDGVVLHDYWHYVLGRWEFSLLRSNPGAVRLYRLGWRAYQSAIGCTPRA